MQQKVYLEMADEIENKYKNIHCLKIENSKDLELTKQELKEKIGMNGVRIVGNPEDKMKRVAIVAHLYPNSAMVDEIKEDGYYHSYDMEIMKYMETENIDAIIPGEIIEWTILSYIRDAAYMGKHKACFNIGHFNMEELGMKYAADWIGELLNNEIPVNYIPTEDGWTFL